MGNRTIFGTKTTRYWNKLLLTVPASWHISSFNFMFIRIYGNMSNITQAHKVYIK